MYFWYKIFTYLFYPFAPFYLYLRKIRNKEHVNRYKEKLSKINLPRGDGFLIWIHVASVGEAMSVLPLIDNYIKEEKVDKILITSITLSSGKILEKKFDNSSKVFHQFLPLDIKMLTNKFLEHWKPNLSIFIDSEIWPNLITQISEKKIPLLLVNARITQKSFDRWKIAISFARKIFEKFDLCIASNKETEKFLKILGAKNIKSYGNLKFSNIKTEKKQKFDERFLEKIKNRRIWCAASTHPDEEIICAGTHIEIKKKIKNVLTIIIPRHIERVKKIEKDLLKLNLKIVTSDQLEKLASDTDILLINSYGESLKFYNISRNVFLGKSLVKSLIKNSGQNPIEAARLGCKIFHGPNVRNFIEIYDLLNKFNITKTVNNSQELELSLVEEFKKNNSKNIEIAEKIENYGQNILNSVIVDLKKYI